MVSDDASTDDTAEWLGQAYPDVRVIRAERNGGFCAAAMPASRRPAAGLSSCSITIPRSPPAGSKLGWRLLPTRPSARSRHWFWCVRSRAGWTPLAIRMPWPAGRPSAGTASPPRCSRVARVEEVFGASGSSAFYRAEVLRRLADSTHSRARIMRTSTSLSA